MNTSTKLTFTIGVTIQHAPGQVISLKEARALITELLVQSPESRVAGEPYVDKVVVRSADFDLPPPRPKAK